jgi:predicted DNA-binding protein
MSDITCGATADTSKRWRRKTMSKTNSVSKVRGEHYLNVFVSFELKDRLRKLAARYDRTTSDIVRAVLRIGIPMMEGLSEAEETMVKEYVDLFRRLRQVKALKDI